jgi:hypothetical protein
MKTKVIFYSVIVLIMFGCTVYHNYNCPEGVKSIDGFRITASKYRDLDLGVWFYIDSVKSINKILDLKISIFNDKEVLFSPFVYWAHGSFSWGISPVADSPFERKSFVEIPDSAKYTRIKNVDTEFGAFLKFNDIKTKFIIAKLDLVVIINHSDTVTMKKEFKLYYNRIKTVML